MKAPVEIRPFLLRHLNRVLEIEDACFGEAAYPRELFLELYRECPGMFFVARRSRRIVGYCITGAKEKTAEIVSVAVAPAHQASGVGGRLIRHAMRRLKLRRIRTLTLMVRVDNDAAIGLYRRLGFSSIARISRYYEDRSAGLLMRKQL